MPVCDYGEYAVQVTFNDNRCQHCLGPSIRAQEVIRVVSVSPAAAKQEAMRRPFVNVSKWEVCGPYGRVNA